MKKFILIITIIYCYFLVGSSEGAWAETMNDSAFNGRKDVNVKILNLNIHNGVNWQGNYDLEAIANFIKAENPDLVGLQEVGRFWSIQNNFDDIPGELGKRLKMDYAYSASLERNDGNFGNLILSKYPIIQSWTELLPGTLEKRSFVFTQVMIEGVRVNFLTTHLGLSASDRNLQTETILKFASLVSGPLVITGDFNGNQDDSSVAFLKKYFLDLQGLSSSVNKGTFRLKDGKALSRIDFIFASPEFKLEQLEVVDNYLSDHLPIAAKIALTLNWVDVAGQSVYYQ